MRLRVAIAVVVLSLGTLAAQTFRGGILGTVTDASGAVVSNAKVTVRNVNTGLERATQTSADGSYTVPELPLGTYMVTVSQTGFQTFVANNVAVNVATGRRVDAVLKPGQVTQRIEVSAETLSQVETTSNVLGGAFQEKQLLALPINGRDFTKLLIMVPGAAGEPNGGGDSPGSFGLFSVNGNRGRSNNFLLDGTDMNDGYRNLPAINQGGVFGTPGTVLPLEAITELRVLSNFEPEYGRNSGSVVNIVTKSGTNAFHGSVFEYFRNDKLNARNFFNTAGPKNKFRNNQFGASIGGPIVKDRTFFYGAYEGQRERLGIDSLNNVPTLGDFADAFGAIRGLGGPAPECAAVSIFACVTAQPGGVVNPVILNLFNFCNANGGCSGGHDVWPAANLAGTPNSVSTAGAFNDADSFIVKLDHAFNENNHLSGRYFFGNSDQSFPLGLAGGNNLPGTNTVSPIRAQLVSISFVRVFSPTQVNETRFGWNRYSQDFFAEDAAVFGNPNDSIGLNNGVTQARDFGFPTMQFGDGFAALGSSGFSNPRGRRDTNWQFIDNFSWKLNRHDLKFGYEFRRTTVDSFNDFHFRGRISFGALQDFLAGTPTGFSFLPSGNTNREAHQNSHALYLQDSIRVRRGLTVNLGIRWDYFGVIGEDQDRFSIYDPAIGLKQVSQLYGKDHNNFSPRVSFAWDIGGKAKTVLRGGFGVAYDIFSQDFFTGQIPFNSFNAGLAYNAIGPDPVFFSFSPAAVLAPGVAVFDPATFPTDTTDAFTVDPGLRTPYVYNYNLNLERELFTNTVLQIAYVGSAGRKLFRFRDINQPSQAVITATDLANGFIDIVPRNFSTPLSALAPNAPFYVNQLETSASSSYNALQLSLRQQNWHGLTQQISYTWSHSIDTASDGQDFVPNAAQPNDSTNPRADRGNSNFDTRHRFVWTATYALPKLGRGRLGEGWQVSGVLTFLSGHPFHVNYNFLDDYDGSGQFFGRPDIVGPVTYNRANPLQFLNLTSFQTPCTLNPAGDGSAAFCAPGTRHFGSLGRNSLIGPDYRNLDFAISKDTRLTERLHLLLRADFYNFTNHPNFANPLLPTFIADAAPNGLDPTNGRSLGFLPILATSDVGLGNPVLGGGGQRSIQFAAKFTF